MAANATATSRNTSNSFTTLVPSSGTIKYTSVCALYSVKKYPEAQKSTTNEPNAMALAPLPTACPAHVASGSSTCLRRLTLTML